MNDQYLTIQLRTSDKLMATDIPNPVANSALKICGTQLFVSHPDTKTSKVILPGCPLLQATLPASTFLSSSIPKLQREASFLSGIRICSPVVSCKIGNMGTYQFGGFLSIVVWDSFSCQQTLHSKRIMKHPLKHPFQKVRIHLLFIRALSF